MFKTICELHIPYYELCITLAALNTTALPLSTTSSSSNAVPTLSLLSATAIVIANMIGAGVFTSLGYQLLGISSPFAIAMLWIVGGVVALCGALVYGELGSIFTRSGGEYNFLSQTYHPLIGFLSGWLSATVAFAAPVALACIAFATYFSDVIPGLSAKALAIIVLLVFTGLHSLSVSKGAAVQNVFSILKAALIAVFVIAGILTPSQPGVSFMPQADGWSQVFTGTFAVSLVFVSYTYSGWNAAAYITAEIKDAKRNLPLALLLGTLIVTVLYVGINMVFMHVAPVNEMRVTFDDNGPHNFDTGFIAGKYVFGAAGARIVAGLIAFALVSSISAMTMAGPRVTKTIAEDFSAIDFLSRTNKAGAPYMAIILQSAISILLILTGTFGSIIKYIGFTLSLSTLLTVIGIFIVRARKQSQGSYKCWGYPVTPVVFIAFSVWMLWYLLKGVGENHYESLYGLFTVAIGIPFFYLGRPKGNKKDLTTNN